MSETRQNNNVLHKPVVVIALLDWGLGHTTRSIAIIRHLIQLNYNIIVACSSIQKAILVEELPSVEYVHLDGYDVKYAKSGWGTIVEIILQIPKILTRIKKERRWLRLFVQEKRVDLVISDNRFGFYSSKITSIFVTHQLNIKSGTGQITDRLIRFFNYRYINRFSHCWVPDYVNGPNLAGLLSHPVVKPRIPLHYLGCLSRFEPCIIQNALAYNIVIILSGPEPQRTFLENMILGEAHKVSMRIVLIRGLPGHTENINAPPHITVYNFIQTNALNRYLCEATYVIGRSGYTSIMDYMKIGVRSILIPTPGQAEQEYLAQHMHEQGLALAIQQKDFSLIRAIQEASIFHYKKIDWNMEGYKLVINDYINSIIQ